MEVNLILNAISSADFSNPINVDERNKRLVVEGYPQGTKPLLFSRDLIDLAKINNLGKIWLWALPADVPEFIKNGFVIEGSLFRGCHEEFAVSLAYYVRKSRGYSANLQLEDDIIHTVRAGAVDPPLPLLPEMELILLNESFAPQISMLLTHVFQSYPSPVENPSYIRSLFPKGNIFAGALYKGELIAVTAAYPDSLLKRCEMTDCATREEFRGYSLCQRLLSILEHEVKKQDSIIIYTLARARSHGMNRVFHKLGYSYQGRLINNCDIAGSFEDMNLWAK